MNPYGFPPMPTEMRAKRADLLKQDGLHLVYTVPVEPGEKWKQKLGFPIKAGVNVTFVMFVRRSRSFRVCVNESTRRDGYVELGTFDDKPQLHSRLRNTGKQVYGKASSNPLEQMKYFTCRFEFTDKMTTKGFVNEILIATHTVVPFDVLDEIFVHPNKVAQHQDTPMISIHVTASRSTVEGLFSNHIPNTRLAQNFVGSVMTILGVYKRDSAASNDKIQLDVYERNTPHEKIRLEVDPGTIGGTEMLVQVKFAYGSVTAEGPGGKDVKPTTFPGLTDNCAVQIARNFQVKRVKVEAYLFKDPTY